jgi:hypothetical protein
MSDKVVSTGLARCDAGSGEEECQKGLVGRDAVGRDHG